ncbi:MAG: hypothetical protein ACTHN5_15070 [Phycisphaerae bacterium]
MMIGSSRTYAIGMAHFQMGGGWKSLVTVCAAYLVLVLAVVGLVYYAEMSSGMTRGPRGVLTDVAVTLVVIMECISLVVFGGFRVAGAIRGDLGSHMIESHRLMPVPNWRAVMGYMFWPTTQTIGFAVLNLVLAYVFAGLTGTDLGKVTMGQATLFAFALLVWSGCAVGTFVARYLVFVALAVAMPGACILYWVYVGLPAVSLLTSPLIGQSIFVFTRGVAVNPWIYTASFLAQGAFFALFFAGACRRYRGTYLTTFSMGQSLLLVVTWSAATAAALALGNDVRLQGMFGRMREEDFHVGQIICSVIAGMLIALVPLRTLVIVQRGKRRSWVVVAGMMLGIIVALSLMPVGAMGLYVVPWENVTATAMGIGAFVVTMYGLLYLTRNFRPWVMGLIVGAVMLALWCVPLFLEVVRAIYLSNHGAGAEVDAGFGVFGNFSPVGMLIDVWNDGKVSPVAGLVGQWVVGVSVGVWGVVARERVEGVK